MTKKLALLMPATSRKSGWGSIFESFLATDFLPSLIFSSWKERDIQFNFYIGADKGDPVYNEENLKTLFWDHGLNRFTLTVTEFQDIEPGNLVAMWNELFVVAIEA